MFENTNSAVAETGIGTGINAMVKVFLWRYGPRGIKEVLLVLNKERRDAGGKLVKPRGWGMTGGRFDPSHDTDLVATAFREAKEETGLDVAVDPDYLLMEDRGSYKIYVFAAEIVGGKIRRQSEEIDDVDWAPMICLCVPAENTYNRSGQKIPVYKYKGEIIYKGDCKKITEILSKDA